MGVPCDQCRHRRVRCTGSLPCDKCVGADLRCRYEYVPKRRGPKHGVGKVIAQLKSLDAEQDKNVNSDVNHDRTGSPVVDLSSPTLTSTTEPASLLSRYVHDKLNLPSMIPAGAIQSCCKIETHLGYR
jgi:hypothetical protein